MKNIYFCFRNENTEEFVKTRDEKHLLFRSSKASTFDFAQKIVKRLCTKNAEVFINVVDEKHLPFCFAHRKYWRIHEDKG